MKKNISSGVSDYFIKELNDVAFSGVLVFKTVKFSAIGGSHIKRSNVAKCEFCSGIPLKHLSSGNYLYSSSLYFPWTGKYKVLYCPSKLNYSILELFYI